MAPLDHHLRPFITTSWVCSSTSMEVEMLPASDEATSGSVIAKDERISPAASGASQRSCCSGVPWRSSSSMLPTSGLLALIASGARCGDRPDSSTTGARSRWLSPEP